MNMDFRTTKIESPPIVELMETAKEYLSSPRSLNLAQGVSGHTPPQESLDSVSGMMIQPSVHRYTADEGLLELREELALYLRRHSGIDANPVDELVITGGANQALAGAVLTLLKPGTNVIMPTPYYFNAVMAVQLCGCSVKEVPVDGRFQPIPESIAKAIDKKTRAVVLVSPNNPTGAVYDQRVIESIVDICIDNDLMLISDETYARMVFDGSAHCSPMRHHDSSGHVVALGSFSKDFGMSGWRIGYIIGSPEFIREFMKFQDTMVICAPTPSQLLALDVLRNGTDTVDEEMARLGRLRDMAYVRMAEIAELHAVRTSGTFYLFPKVTNCTDSRSIVLDILRKESMLLLPGSVFGRSGEGFMRISIGPLTPEAVDEAFNRLEHYFASR